MGLVGKGGVSAVCNALQLAAGATPIFQGRVRIVSNKGVPGRYGRRNYHLQRAG